ncbi:MAG TPA: hypothetical protein VMV69_18455 [Pirellulales bacterium]|nr:hypothetical protein [Pirellulales bacterium]
MTTDQLDQPQLAPRVRELLGALRRRIRRYVWLEGLAATLASLGVCFWVALAIDWLFEPPAEFRRVMLGVVAVVSGYVLYRVSLRRVFVPLSDRNMAVLLERRFDRFDDGLLTAVELTGRKLELDEYGREMLAHTCDEAYARADRVELSELFRRAPLLRAVVAASVLALSVLALAVAAPGSFRFGVRRLATLTNEPWPRNTRLRVVGFDNPGREVVIARGSELRVVVQAETAPPRVVPRVVQIRYRTADGNRDRKTMDREGNAVPGVDPLQDFSLTFPGVLADHEFDVIGGDARLKGYRIRVVESPTIGMTLHCEYPAYMGRPAADVPGTGNVALPRGTKVTVHATASKDLLRARIDYTLDDKPRDLALDGRRDFEFTLENLDADKTVLFTLLDTDGIESRQPVPLVLTAVPDEPPQVLVYLEGIGSAITSQARLPLAGEIKDDYGVAKTWIDYVVDDQEPREAPLVSETHSRAELPVEAAFEVGELSLKPGQKLLIGAKAADNHSLPGDEQPNVSSGERFLLDVVTPEQLRAILESRELNLRQRFESIIQEVTETRDSLAELETHDVAPPTGGADDTAPAAGREPAGAADLAEAVRARRRLRVERAAQSGQKDAEETRGVALSFDGIRAELVNNRLDTEELRIRLKDQIADPLKRIAGERFAELDKRLAALLARVRHAKPADAAALAELQSGRQAALEQTELILLEMRQVRDKMLELETFNEALDRLREIIELQKILNEQTKKLRQEKVRHLLEDEE